MRTFVVLLMALSFLGFASPVPATVIVPIGPFTGALSENFESFGPGCGGPSTPWCTLPSPLPIMGGNASLEGFYSILSIGGGAYAMRSGLQEFLNWDSPPNSIVFETPVLDFGAYWKTDGTPCPPETELCVSTFAVQFGDAAGSIIYQEWFQYRSGPWDISYDGGVFVWYGWSSSVPIAFVDFGYITSSNHFASITGIQANVVPEPSTLLLLGSGLAGAGGVAWRRHRKG